MLLMLNEVLPVLLNVTIRTGLLVVTNVVGKARLVGESLTCVPMPVRVIECALAGSLSLILTVAGRLPVAVGVNVTVMLQLAWKESELGQLVVWL